MSLQFLPAVLTRCTGLWLAISMGATLACAAGAAHAKSTPVVKAPAKLAKELRLERVQRGLKLPLGLEIFAGDPLERLFVVEQVGTIRAIREGKVDETPLLDVSALVSREHNEQGLLGLAFHPKFAKNGRLFINYTDAEGATRVAEHRADVRTILKGERISVGAKAVRDWLVLEQPWRNHNGGYLAFGPDGKLYIGTGDGGAAGDPKLAGQDAKNRLGKMLRIDVDRKLAAHARAKIDIVQTGLRNPWRYNFDAKTGDLYIADVGQDKWEEVSVVAADKIEGTNLGWSDWEGTHCYRKSRCRNKRMPKSMTPPVVEFDHGIGCSVTGGEVYRGKAIPELDGVYFYSDYCTAIVRSFRWSEKDGLRDHWDWKSALDPRFRLANVSAFGVDHEGEMYLVSSEGSIYKLVRAQ